MAENRYNRVLLKLSGGLLSGDGSSALKADALAYFAEEIGQLTEKDVSAGIVIGGGNYFRGRSAGEWGLEQTTTDYMGMLGTVMNGLALAEYLRNDGRDVLLQSAITIEGIVPVYDQKLTVEALDAGEIVIFVGGTGHPYFSTDTTAALRACEIGADVLLKATDVDGVYDTDPDDDPDAKLFTKISYHEALERGLGVMDATATALCMENDIPVVVFNFNEPGNLFRVLKGNEIGTYMG
ncbi:MAG: UMP kinase [bacterium]|nr:UMP kinase [bacterium]